MNSRPRYELRAFSPSFGIVERRIREGGEPTGIRESWEVYLVTRHSGTWNVKFRDKHLDIKKLIDQSDELELWEPQVKLDLPLDAEKLCKVLVPALGIEEKNFGDLGEMDLSNLLDTLNHHCPQVVIVDLFKRRFGFEIGDCLAELAEVRINGAGIQTACIESTNPGSLKRLAYTLGLDVYRNVNYVKALQRVTGLIRKPLF